MKFYFTPWKIKETDSCLLVEIIDVSGATVATEVEKAYAELIVDAVNEKGKRLIGS